MRFAGLAAVAMSIYIMSLADAAMTLELLSTGVAEEVNPIMHWLIEYDTGLFILVKAVVTGGCVGALLGLSNMFRGARYSLYAMFALYAPLMVYEIYLLNYL